MSGVSPAVEDESVAAPTIMQSMLGLPLIGEYLATGVALIPAILLTFAREWLGMTGEPGGGYFVLVGILSAYWLAGLEESGRVRITTPHLPIPLLWLTPLVVLYGIVEWVR